MTDTLDTSMETLKSALGDKVAEMKRIGSTFTIEDNGGVVVSTDQATEYRKLLGEANELKTLIADREGGAELERFMAQPDGKSAAVAAAAAQAETKELLTEHAQSLGYKTVGEMFTESEEFKALRASGGAHMTTPWEVEGVDLGSMWHPEKKDVYSAMPTGPTRTWAFGRTQRDPMVPLPQRTQRVRDLFPVQRTDAALIDYFRVTGFTNNASPVPERAAGAFALKPQSSLTFAAAQAPVRTIAHWEAAHRNVLADEPQLQGIINNELLYGLRLQEDYQILQGQGTSEDLLGLLNTPDVQEYDQGDNAEDNKADAVRRAMTLVLLAYFEPTGVVMHPYDWEDIELLKDSNERYLVTGSVAIGAEKKLWRLNVVDTPAIPEGTFLTGAFGLGAQLYDREVANIRIAEQHADFFLRNAVVILAEERLALAVKRPESFVIGEFTA